MLTSLRAPARVQKDAYEAVQTDAGPTVSQLDGMCNQLFAMLTLGEAFKVPYCFECVHPARSPKFPFAVESNERLVDALDKLKQNSNGFFEWMLLHQRIVLSAQPPAGKNAIYIMDRPISVQIGAETLQAALEQVEAAYNKQYFDLPLVVLPTSPRLVPKARPEASGETGKFVLKQEGTLREAVLAILDQMQDPAVCYGLSEMMDRKDRRYFALNVKKDDAPDLDTFADGNEVTLAVSMAQSSMQRLQGYLDRAEKAARSPDKAAAGETKP
jgi:hypothetical protein